MVTKWHGTGLAGLISGAFCTVSRARPFGNGPGPKFGRTPRKNPFPRVCGLQTSPESPKALIIAERVVGRGEAPGEAVRRGARGCRQRRQQHG